MIKKQITLIVLCLLVTFTYAQTDWVPAGGTANGSNGSVTYTVGQIAVQTAGDGDKSVLEGLQQPYEIQTIGVNEYPGITLQAVVFPNPTQHFVQLKISNYEMPEYGLIAQLYDANGRLLQNITITELETRLDLSNYAAAAYQLRVMDGKRLLKTFKIIKNRAL